MSINTQRSTNKVKRELLALIGCPEPHSPEQLRGFVTALRPFLECREEMLMATVPGREVMGQEDYQRDIAEAVWSMLRCVAGGSEYPPRPDGLCTHYWLTGAFDRVAQWCHDQERRQAQLAPESDPPALTTPVKRPTKGKNIDARMLKMLAESPGEALGWSLRKWAARLGCCPSTVADTKTWQERIKPAAAAVAADAAARMDRSRTRPRGGKVVRKPK